QMQQSPMMPMMPMPQRPVAQVNFPTQYQGPMPPNPIQQVAYQQPAQTQFNPAMDRRTVAHTQAVNQAEMGQLFQVLKQSLYPAQREWAANNLSTYDPRQHPEVVAVLLDCAKQDPAATVRASCVYSVSRMGVTSEAIVGTLQSLRQDGDARVRQEVEQAL